MTTEKGNGSKSPGESVADLLARQTEVLEGIARPYVVVDVYPSRYVNILYFRIRNVGQTPAFGIRVQPRETIQVAEDSSDTLNIFRRPIGVLGPGDEISFFFGSVLELLEDEDSILQFDVRLEYTDSNDKAYEDEISVDAELLHGLAVRLPAVDKMLQILNRTQSDVRKIARYVETRRRDLRQSMQEGEEADHLSSEDTTKDSTEN